MRVVEKAFAYITNAQRLLVFQHVGTPEAGIQVPAGSIRSGESPLAAAVREAEEETSLRGFAGGSFLGVSPFDARPYGKDELHRRFFFHLPIEGDVAERWRSLEHDPSDGGLEPIPFECYWVPLREARQSLSFGHDALLGPLIAGCRMAIELTEYQPAYRNELVGMWRRSFEAAVGVTDPHPIAEQRKYFDEKLVLENSVVMVRDFTTSRVIAFMASTRERISQLFVHVDCQGQGIGTMLLDLAKRESTGVLRLFTFQVNRKACAFYERHGFKAVRYGFEEEWRLADVEYEWRSPAALR